MKKVAEICAALSEAQCSLALRIPQEKIVHQDPISASPIVQTWAIVSGSLSVVSVEA